jgi:hypothetical protein
LRLCMFYVAENYWLSRLPLPSAGIIHIRFLQYRLPVRI